MLPVQTVMIRYMVLVYRWGSGWLGAVGAWGGLAHGCSGRADALAAWAAATRPGRARVRKGPADKGLAGPFRGEGYSVLFFPWLE